MDVRGAAELNDYADQVDDFEHRLHERTRSLENIMRDYAATVAEYQSKQISRLTVVSVIFLPMTFLTGLFGMNFNWMIHIANESAFYCAWSGSDAFNAHLSVMFSVRAE
jgi:Mg2+ and Co2+ transporter CorA